MTSRRTLFATLPAAVGFLALAIIAAQLWLEPAVLRLAVWSESGSDQQLMTAFASLIQRDKASVRIAVRSYPSPEAVAAAINNGDVDLAVVRTDAALPRKAETVAVLRQRGLVLAVPPDSPIKSFSDLKGRSVGLVESPDASVSLISRVLDQHGMFGETTPQVKPLSPAEASQALRQGRIEGVLLFAGAGSPLPGESFEALFRATGEQLTLLPVEEAEAIAARDPRFATYEIGVGAFGSSPARPAAALKTVAYSVRLMARRDLPEEVVAGLTRRLLAARLSLARTGASEAVAIRAPEMDRAAALPIHPGTLAFLDGEQETFFDRWGDALWLGVFGLSGLGSTGAAVAGWQAGRERRRIMGRLNELRAMIAAIPAAPDEASLLAIECAFVALMDHVLQELGSCEIDKLDVNGFLLAGIVFQQTLQQRRQALDVAEDGARLRPGLGRPLSEVGEAVSSLSWTDRMGKVA